MDYNLIMQSGWFTAKPPQLPLYSWQALKNLFGTHNFEPLSFIHATDKPFSSAVTKSRQGCKQNVLSEVLSVWQQQDKHGTWQECKPSECIYMYLITSIFPRVPVIPLYFPILQCYKLTFMPYASDIKKSAKNRQMFHGG